MSTCYDICHRHKKPFQLVCENKDCNTILCGECWLYADDFIRETPSEIHYYCYDCIKKKRKGYSESNCSLNETINNSSTQDSDKTTLISYAVDDHFFEDEKPDHKKPATVSEERHLTDFKKRAEETEHSEKSDDSVTRALFKPSEDSDDESKSSSILTQPTENVSRKRI